MQHRKKRMLAACLAMLLCLCACGTPAAPTLADTEPPEIPSLPPESSGLETETAAPSAEATEAPTEATEPPTETEPSQETLLWEWIDAMTLEAKIAQMFIVTPEALTGDRQALTAVSEALQTSLDEIPVGGFILMGANLENAEQVKTLCADLQAVSAARSGLPLFLCVDEEGGSVARISGTGRFDVPEIPSMAEIGASGDPEAARAIGEQIGTYLSELGLTVDFAPVADVLTNPENTVVKSRSFGADGELVTQMARAFAGGLQSKGVLATYKHFPGHGATTADSHKGFASADRTKDELIASELLPFADAASAGIPFIMAGHITLPNVTQEPVPASLSRELLTDLLRGELGYDGIILTDAMSMGAIKQNYDPGEAAVLAIQAGNDMLLLSEQVQTCRDAILAAIERGELTEARIDESVFRILRTKLGGAD